MLNPLGKQFIKAVSKYLVCVVIPNDEPSSGSEARGKGEGVSSKNSVSILEPRISRASSPLVMCNGIRLSVTWLRRCFPDSVMAYRLGKRRGRYVLVSHSYSSRTAGTASELHARTS